MFFIHINERESLSVVSDSLLPHGLYSPWNSLGQSTGVGCLSLLQGIFPTQGWNPGLLCCRPILYQLRHRETQCIYTHIYLKLFSSNIFISLEIFQMLKISWLHKQIIQWILLEYFTNNSGRTWVKSFKKQVIFIREKKCVQSLLLFFITRKDERKRKKKMKDVPWTFFG